MRNASGHQGENERQNDWHVRHFLHKTCNQEVSGSFVVMHNNGKEMYQKSVLRVQSCFFAN